MTKPTDYPQSPAPLWNRFYDFTQIPHPSKKEEKILAYIIDSAKKAGLDYKQDDTGNVVIYVPASKGYENNPTVIIQNHVDMVCDKMPDLKFDFDRDPLNLLVKDGWLCADRTTLGADNGFGAAAALALIDEKDVKHPALELLFTVDEETGLGGALGLDASMLKGKKLINLDTEEWGAVYVGCAGGVDYTFSKEVELRPKSQESRLARITIANLKGGHSGLNIHQGRGNAIKLLSEILWELVPTGFGLVELRGGRAHNIIPRDAYVLISIDDIEAAKSLCEAKRKQFLTYLPPEDHGITIEFEEVEETKDIQVVTEIHGSCFMALLSLFPHGAHGYNWHSEEPLVSYSNNLAICNLIDGRIYIKTSVRFFESHQAIELEQKLEALALGQKGMELKKGNGYPSWSPVFDSPMVSSAKEIYQKNFNEELKVKAIHAGLECGILKDKIGYDMEAISIGPNITGAHSPTESLEIDSANKMWYFLVKILESL